MQPREMSLITEAEKNKKKQYGTMNSDDQESKSPSSRESSTYQPFALGNALMLAGYEIYRNLPRFAFFSNHQSCDPASGLNQLSAKLDYPYPVVPQLAAILLNINQYSLTESFQQEQLFISLLNQSLNINKADYIKVSSVIKADLLYVLDHALATFSLNSKEVLLDYKSRVENDSINDKPRFTF